MSTDPGDLVLDPTCGSGTTAYIAEQWGRRWITIDTSRGALALARARIMAARYAYYLLADSADGLRKETEMSGRPFVDKPTYGNVRHGFVYERVPHVTLKSIANNAEIDIIWQERQPKVQAPLDRLNDALRGPKTPYELIDPLAARETSPPYGESFERMILDNLRTAGVQQAHKEGRVAFTSLVPWPGEMICAEGRYREGDTERRAAIFIGPEFGTVSRPDLVAAAREAGDAR